MIQVLRSLIDIALLRRDPGALPASVVLLALGALLFGALNMLEAGLLYGNDRLLGRAIVEVGLALGLFGLVFAVMRRGHRYLQSMTAVFGTYLLIAPLIAVSLVLQGPAISAYGVWMLGRVAFYALTVWFLLVIAHIVRSALETGLLAGFAIAITWVLAAVSLSRTLFPKPA